MRRVTGSLLAVVLLAVPSSLVRVTPPRGPGAVEDAVRAFVDAMNAGDRTKLEAIVARETDQKRVLVWDQEQGQPGTSEGRAALLERFARASSRAEPKPGAEPQARARWQQKITNIWAMCESPHCGYAYVDLERTHGTGKEARVERLRATALAEYVGGEGATWRVFHWHVSPAAATRTEAPATGAISK